MEVEDPVPPSVRGGRMCKRRHLSPPITNLLSLRMTRTLIGAWMT